MPTISVIVPVYNSEKTIERCITTLCSQETSNSELGNGGGYLFDYQIIAVDDGSTDSSLEILKKLSLRYQNLKVLNKKNGGAASARKYGIENSESDYLAFCDSDDYVEPDWLLTMYEYLVRYDADISMVGAYLNDKDLDQKHSKPYNIWEWNQDTAYRKYLEHVHLNGVLWTNLFKRELFDDLEWNMEMVLGEDDFLIWQILGKIKKIVKVRVAKYHYMYNSQSLTRKEYSFDRYKSYRILTDRIVSDCSSGEMQKYNYEAKVMQCKWTYRNLSSITTSSYKNKIAEDAMASILRNNWRITLSITKGIRNKIIAILLMTYPPLVRAMYSLTRK